MEAFTYLITQKECRNSRNKTYDFLHYILSLIEIGANYKNILKLKELYDNTKVNSANTHHNEELECFNTMCSELKRGVVESKKLDKKRKNESIAFIKAIISDNGMLLSAVKRQDEQSFSSFFESRGCSITNYFQGNNLLHNIVLLPESEENNKVIYLQFLLECLESTLESNVFENEINNALRDKNSEGLTPLQALLLDRIKKMGKESNYFSKAMALVTAPFSNSSDKTLECALVLLKEYRADVNDLEFDVGEKGKKTYHELLGSVDIYFNQR